MGASLTAVILTFAAIVGAVFLSPRAAPAFQRILAVWLGVTVIAFMLPAVGVAMMMIGALLTVSAMTSRENRIYIFIAAQFIVPKDYSVQVPFPGLNYLIDLSYGNLIALVLLAPSLFRRFLAVSPHI